MHRAKFTQFFFLLMLCSATDRAFSVSEPKPLDPAKTISSVWALSAQPCNGGIGNAFFRFPGETTIEATKQVSIKEIGYVFSIPQIPGNEDTVVKIHLDDHSRGVTDHYLLLADYYLDPPFAAIVITTPPKDTQTREAAFKAVEKLEKGLAEPAGLNPTLTRINGPYGEALEMLVPNRIGTHCFPTSTFALIPPNERRRTLGISRFVFVKNKLIEFSLILRRPWWMSQARADAYARSIMDRFLLALRPIQ